MKLAKWSPLSVHVLKQRSILKDNAKDHLRYSDIMIEDFGHGTLQFLIWSAPSLDLLSMVTFSEVPHQGY